MASAAVEVAVNREYCGLKNNNNNNDKEPQWKRRKEKKMHSRNNTLGNLFLFFTPLYTPSEVDRVKKFRRFLNGPQRFTLFFLLSSPPFGALTHYLFLNNAHTLAHLRTYTCIYVHTKWLYSRITVATVHVCVCVCVFYSK